MEKEEDNYFRIEIKKRRPKKNAKTYRIETLQDILQAVDSKNVNKFLREFKVVLHSNFLVKAIHEGLVSEGKISPETKPPLMTHFDWIDD